MSNERKLLFDSFDDSDDTSVMDIMKAMAVGSGVFTKLGLINSIKRLDMNISTDLINRYVDLFLTQNAKNIEKRSNGDSFYYEWIAFNDPKSVPDDSYSFLKSLKNVGDRAARNGVVDDPLEDDEEY